MTVKTARCHSKLCYVSKFTAASHGSTCDSTAFLLFTGREAAITMNSVNNRNHVDFVSVALSVLFVLFCLCFSFLCVLRVRF